MRLNVEKAREAMRRWRKRHPSEHATARDTWDAEHPAAANARRRKYARAHPEVRRVIGERRRARAAKADGAHTAREWLDLVAAYADRCAYCGGPGPLQVDHRTPLARGGSNSIDNILPACGPCNRRKHKRTEAEFRALLDKARPDPLT